MKALKSILMASAAVFLSPAPAIEIDPSIWFAYFDSAKHTNRAPQFFILLSHQPCPIKEDAQRGWKRAKYVPGVNACWVKEKTGEPYVNICPISPSNPTRTVDGACEWAAMDRFWKTDSLPKSARF